MKRILKWLALAPVLAVVLAFAVVNRQSVTVVFDPFGDPKSGLAISGPLFLALFAAAIIGVVLGGAVTWIGQARHRRAAREARAELARFRIEKERTATQAVLPQPSATDRTAA